MQPQKYPIKDWANDDQPREKLLSKTPRSLSDIELLAILIRSGTKNTNAVELATRLLAIKNNNLQALGQASIKEFQSIKGIGPAKAAAIMAALELGRRRQASLPLDLAVLKASSDVAAYLRAEIQHYSHELFGVIYLNNAAKVLKFAIVSEGGMTSTVVDPRIILKQALEVKACGMILCHNHPSGNLRPSRMDIDLTERIRQCAQLFDIQLMDHLIVSQEGYYSFADSGLLSEPASGTKPAR